MARYRKKPVVVDAFQWTGDHHQIEDPVWICEAIRKGNVFFTPNGTTVKMHIRTLGGWLIANVDDWIIQGTVGEIYPCKPNIFADIYEPE